MKTFFGTALCTWFGLMFLWILVMYPTGAAIAGGAFAFNTYIQITGVASILFGAVAQLDDWIEAIRELNPEYLQEKKYQQAVKKYQRAVDYLELGKQRRAYEDKKLFLFTRNYFEAERLEREGRSALLESAALDYKPAVRLATSMGLLRLI